MPRRAVHHRLERGVNVLGRTASPFFAARHQLQLDHAFGSEVNSNNAVQILRGRRHEHTNTFLQCCQHFRPPNELRNVWRTNFLFAFGHHHQAHGHLLSRAADRMECRQERCFRSFLIHHTAAEDYFAQLRFVYDSRFGRRRRPLRRIELFHVIHEIEANRFRRACIQCCEHTRFPAGVDHRRLLKSGITREFRHVLRAFRISAILRRDRDLPYPVLQPLHGLIMPLRNLGFDCGEIVFS